MRLRVADIGFSYNCLPVLQGIDFCVEGGSILAILGENGAGKSTLLKCLNRVLRPNRGSVLLNEENVARLPQKALARRMGYVPQQHSESPLTVYESVLLGRVPHLGWRVSDDDYDRVEKILGRLGLRDLAMRPVTHLSGGEAQKVLIARALAQDPCVLLLDEPTSNLDLKNQLEVMGLVRSIVDSDGPAAIVAIHDLNLALRVADTLLFLKNHAVHALVDRTGITADIIADVYGIVVTIHHVQNRIVIVPN